MGISKNITKKIANYNSENSIAFKLRKKRSERIKTIISEIFNEFGEVKIIDIGGTKTYWKIIPHEFLKENNVHITLVNLPDSVDKSESDEMFTYQDGDGCNLENYETNSFHLSHSNSVIEHVGSWKNKKLFAKESQRVAKKHYLQTPNFWFPIEPHFMSPFFHWLPDGVRVAILMRFNLGWYKKAKTKEEAQSYIDYASLLTAKELKELFPNSHLMYENLFAFKKSLIVFN